MKKLKHKLPFLIKTHAPLSVLFYTVKTHFAGKRLRNNPTYAELKNKFKNHISSLTLSQDWFTHNIPCWLSIFEQYNLENKSEVHALEIGSWEGLSSYFILSSLPNASLTCVDTWEGADEHKSDNGSWQKALNHLEATFDNNLTVFKARLTKYKGNSFSFFNENSHQKKFDFIYVDGSHYSDDVLIDALKCFEMLKIGGVMIFDDYLWTFYQQTNNNPAPAINAFLRLKRRLYKIVSAGTQIIIEKTGDSLR